MVRSSSCAAMPSPADSAPCGSRSTSSTRRPYSASAAPRLMVDVVLPTPPFWLHIASTMAGPWLVTGAGSGSRPRIARRAGDDDPATPAPIDAAAPAGSPPFPAAPTAVSAPLVACSGTTHNALCPSGAGAPSASGTGVPCSWDAPSASSCPVIRPFRWSRRAARRARHRVGVHRPPRSTPRHPVRSSTTNSCLLENVVIPTTRPSLSGERPPGQRDPPAGDPDHPSVPPGVSSPDS